MALINILFSNEDDTKRLLLIDNLKWLRPQEYYNKITSLAATVCETPMSLISVVKKHTQEFKSTYGLNEKIVETPRLQSFCQYTLNNPSNIPFIIEDASQDERFKNNPLVTGYPFIKFYCGFPLLSENNTNLGALCVIDTKPRQLSELQKTALNSLTFITKEYSTTI